MYLFTLCLSSIFFHTVVSYVGDFYWKDYRGEIPRDAFPAGRDENGRDTYIGQAYIHKYALAVAQIFPGKKEVDAACYGVKRTNKNIKIFCTKHPKKLSWVSTSAQTYKKDMVGLHPVRGGADEKEANKGRLDIGRVTYQGILKIGAVASYDVTRDHVSIFFPHGDFQRSSTKFQVLTYNNSMVDDDSENDVVPCVDIRNKE